MINFGRLVALLNQKSSKTCVPIWSFDTGQFPHSCRRLGIAVCQNEVKKCAVFEFFFFLENRPRAVTARGKGKMKEKEKKSKSAC